MAEASIVGYGIDKGAKGAYIYMAAKLKTLTRKIKLATEIGKLNFTKVDFNLVKKGVQDTEIVQFQKILSSTLSGFDNAKKGRFIERMLLMDDYTKNQYFNNLEDYASSFEVGGKYNLLLQGDDFGKRIVLQNIDGKIVDGKGFPIKNKEYVDFIVTKASDGGDWIAFGEKHSYLSNGENINYAGEFKFNKNTGVLIGFTNRSGHYLPKSSDLEGLQKLKNAYKNRFGLEFNLDFVTKYNN